jgi:hypothetical protein
MRYTVMNPARVKRNKIRKLTDLPNIGPAMAKDLEAIGIRTPVELIGKDPCKLYRTLCIKSGTTHDQCIAITRFMDGEEPRPWWDYTEERKRVFAAKLGFEIF